jgi:uncharacterized membrane protein
LKVAFRKIGWIAVTASATIVALYAVNVLLIPGFGPPFVADRRALMPWALGAHLVGGLTAIAIGPWQLNSRLRARALGLHRWLGRSYVIAVVVGGVGALSLARVSLEGLVTHVGFGMLAVLWLAATLQAYRRIRAGDQVEHQRWMIRSYALTLAAVTLRVYLALGQLAGMPFAETYQAVAWVSWVPNLVIAEWWILRPAEAPGPPLVAARQTSARVMR